MSLSIALLFLNLFASNTMSSSTPSNSSNTPALAGVWQRVFEEDPLGDATGADRDTLVLWSQAPESGIYVDLRLPRNSSGRSAIAGACCPPRPSALAATGMSDSAKKLLLRQRDGAPYYDALLQQKSFAGVLDSQLGDTTESGAALKQDVILRELADHAAVEETQQQQQHNKALPLNTCFWRRDIDYQPPAGLDIGVCASQIPFADGSVLMRETGDDASYAEGWLRLAGTNQGPFMALELQSESSSNNNSNESAARKGFWVRTHNRFAYAVGHPETVADAQLLLVPEASAKIKECQNQSLAGALKSLLNGEEDQQNAMLDVLGSYVAVTGEIVTSGDSDDSEKGASKWRIQYSTHPELVGCELVGSGEFSCSTLVQHGDDFGLVEQRIATEDGSVVKRVWKVIELTAGCEMPLCKE